MALKKKSNNEQVSKTKKKKQIPAAVVKQESSRIRKMNERDTHTYTPKEEYLDQKFLVTVDLMDTKAILFNVRDYPIVVKNGYTNYIQILEVRGKDLSSLSDNERHRTIHNFTNWLTEFSYDFTFQSTTLPTDTNSQIIEGRRVLNIIQRELNDPQVDERKYRQLKDREQIVLQNILAEEAVARELYNAEFLIWLYSDSIEDLQRQVQKARQGGNGDFLPNVVGLEKKEQIIKQYNNQNEKV